MEYRRNACNRAVIASTVVAGTGLAADPDIHPAQGKERTMSHGGAPAGVSHSAGHHHAGHHSGAGQHHPGGGVGFIPTVGRSGPSAAKAVHALLLVVVLAALILVVALAH
jgi:hypothetical protein